MAEVAHALQTLKREEKAILDGLRRARRAQEKENERHAERMAKLRREALALMMRSKKDGFRRFSSYNAPSVVQMAETFGVSRQRVHKMIRDGTRQRVREEIIWRLTAASDLTDEEIVQVLVDAERGENRATEAEAWDVARRVREGDRTLLIRPAFEEELRLIGEQRRKG